MDKLTREAGQLDPSDSSLVLYAAFEGRPLAIECSDGDGEYMVE